MALSFETVNNVTCFALKNYTSTKQKEVKFGINAFLNTIKLGLWQIHGYNGQKT